MQSPNETLTVPGPFADFRIGGEGNPLAAFFKANRHKPALVADFKQNSGREAYAKAVPVLGPELVTNGGFDDASGWGGGGGGGMPTISGGVADYGPHTSGASFLTRTGETLTAGYSIISFDADQSGQLYIDPGIGTYSIVHSAAAGRNEVRAFTGSGNLVLRSNVGGAYAGTLDNVSVREVIGYRAAQSNFAELFPDFSRSGNATMVDSDGLLKWAPHNLLRWSEDLSNAVWALDHSGAVVPTITSNYGIAPDGSLTADRVQLDKTGGSYSRVHQSLSGHPNVNHTAAVWMKTVSGGTENVGLRNFATGVNCVVTGEWKLFTVTINSATPSVQIILFDSIVGNDETADILVWGAHLYRSDLGGMVDNPDRGDSYVPTEGSAVFMARRNHHVWDGAAFVNAGLLVESEARTNYAPYSSDWTEWVAAGLAAGATADVLSNGVNGMSFTPYAGAESYRIYDHTNSAWITDRIAYDTAAGADVERQSVTFTTPAGCTAVRVYMSRNDTEAAYVYDAILGLSAQTVYTASWFYDKPATVLRIGGLQLEVGATPSSYIPTNGATVTRAAETLPIPAELLPFHPDGVWMSMGGRYTAGDQDQAFEVMPYIWEQDTSNKVFAYLRSDLSPSLFQFRQYEAGNSDHVTSGEHPLGVNVPFSIAARHGPTYVNGAVNGASLTPNLTPAALANLALADLSVAKDFMGVIKHFTVDAGDPGDAGIAEASA